MRKSFTRLFSLVMLFTLLSSVVMAGVSSIDATKLWPTDPATGTLKAWTKTTDKIMVIYSEAVKAGTGYVRLYEDGALTRSILANDSRISYAKGDTVVIDFSADQNELKEYTVSVDLGTFKTVADGTASSAITTADWKYTVGDYTGPTLTDVEPVKDETVGQLSEIKMTFEDESSIVLGTGKVAIYKADGNVWDLIDVAHPVAPHTVSVTAGVLTITGIRGLEDLTSYSVTVGAGVVTDAQGTTLALSTKGKRADSKVNPFLGLTDRTVWTFNSKDFSVPGFATDYPKIGTVGNTTIDVLVKATEKGTAYALAVPHGDPAPAVSYVLAGTDVEIAAANTEYKISLIDLGSDVSNTPDHWDVYVVTENSDVAATDDDLVMIEDVVTSEDVEPTLADIEYYKGDDLDASGLGILQVDQAITKIVFTFDEAIKVGAGSIIIYNKSDNKIYATIDASAIEIDAEDDTKAIATLPKAFANHADYYAFIPSTLFKDAFNNFYAGITTTTGWRFSTNDIVTPTVVSITPVQGAVDVDRDAEIVVKFSEVMESALGSAGNTIPLFTLEINGDVVDYTYTHSTNNDLFSTVTITPETDATATTDANEYPSTAVVTVTVNGDIEDAQGNVLGLTQGVSFVAEDYQGPTMDFVTETVTGTMITPSTNIVVEFDEPIRLLGGTAIASSNLYSIVTLKEGSINGVNVSADFAINADKNVITITPTTPWTSNKSYYVAISSSVEDASGNKCEDAAADREMVYTVIDNIPATVTIDKAGSTTVGVGDNITFTFKQGTVAEDITTLLYDGTWNDYEVPSDLANVIVLKKDDANGVNIPFTVTRTGAGVFVVDPDAALVGAKTYYVGIGASTKDASGNVSTEKYGTFTTLFVDAPEQVSLAPEDDAIQVGKKVTPVITFNTDIKLGVTTATAYDALTLAEQVTINNAKVAFADLVVSGKTLTIKHTDWAKNLAIDVEIPDGLILNVNSPNVAFGGVATTDWNFTTVDETFAAYTLEPALGAINVDLDAKLKVVVAEEVKAGTGNITIKNAVSDLIIERIASTSSAVTYTYDADADETTIEIVPAANFIYAGTYYVEVDNGAFVDMYNNKINAIVGKSNSTVVPYSWAFAAADDDLEVVKVIPYMVENVAVDADIVVEFNRDIVKGTTGNIGFEEYAFVEGTAKQIVTYGITSTNLTISGNKLTIKHGDKPFTANSTVYVTIQSGAIEAKTKTGSTTSLVKADDMKFYVGDNLPPVATVTPTWDGDLENYSAVNTNIVITFNENVLKNVAGTVALTDANVTYNGGIIELRDGSNALVDFQGTISGRTITLDPTSNLDESSTYTVTILANQIKDTHSHPMDVNITEFKTNDTTVPDVELTLEGGVESVIASDIVVDDANAKNFYYLLKKESETAPTVAQVKAGEKFAVGAETGITIEDLEASTTYVLYFVVDDTFGNTTAVKSEKAKTVDTVAPVLVSTNPVNGTLNFDNAKDVVLTFNEGVQIVGSSTGSIYIKDKATNALIATLDVNALSIVANSDLKKVAIATDFPSLPATQVYFEIESGLIKDNATSANAFAGISGSDKLYFTYEDNQAPMVADFTFTGDDIEHVALNSNLVLTFSEDVQAGTANAILYEGTTAVEVFKGNEVSISGKTVTINPTVNLENGADYTLEVLAGFVKDKSSIHNVSDAYSVEFSTSVDVAPTVEVTSIPEDVDLTNMNKGLLETIVLSFDNDVYLTFAGLDKSLVVLSEADIKSNVTFKKADGTSVPFTVGGKTGTSITLNVDGDDLSHMTSYVLTVSGFKSDAGIVMETTEFEFTTGDGQAPTFVFNPADEAKNVIAASALTITFSEPIFNYADTDPLALEPALFFKPFTNDNVDEILYLIDEDTHDAVAFEGTFNGTNKFTLTPKKPLESGHTYRYGFDGDVTDINGNYVNGMFILDMSAVSLKSAIVDGVQTWAIFTVLDTDKPTFDLEATDVSPENEATSVPADEKMWIAFSEDVLVGTGSITIRYEDGTIFEKVSGASLSISDKTDEGNILLISHKNFDSNAVYFVEVGEGVVTDKAGNKNVAMTDPTKWVFTTKDTFDLTANVTPVGDNTARTVSLTLSFNKAPIAQDNKFLSIYKEDGTAVYQKAVTGLSIVGKDAIYAGVELDADQAYYARVEAGAFQDASDNTFAGIMDKSWVFSTVDNIAPKVVTLAPKDDATAIDTQTSTFTITFDRDIAVGTGVISVRYAVSGLSFEDVNVSAAVITGKTLTFKLTKALDAQTAFYVLVPAGAVTNTEVTKDPFAGIVNVYTWNFTTSTDLTAPKLLTWTPNATTITDNHPTLVMTFDEAVVLGAGNVKIVKKSDNVTALTIPVTAAMVSDKTVTVTYSVVAPATGLDKNTDYYVLVDGGIVKDAAGNATAAVADVAAWTFKTGADFATVIPVINDSQFKVYPNPFVDYVTVTNTSELSKVVVSNIAGQVVKEVVAPESTIQLNELRSGVYFISLYDMDNVIVKTAKIVKR